MLRIKFNSPLLALIATCGMALSVIHAQSAMAADQMDRGGGPGGGVGFGGGGPRPGGPGGGHPNPGPIPVPGPMPGAGGGYHPPGGGGYHPPAPAPAPHPPGGGGGGYHPPAPAPAPHPPGGGGGGYHPPAPAPIPAPHPPGGGGGYHPPGPGHPNPGPIPVPGPAPYPGGGYHPPGGGGHPGPGPGPHPGPGPGYPGGGYPGGGYHPPGGGHPNPGPIPVPGPGYPGHPGYPGGHGPGHGYPPVGHPHGPGYGYGHDHHGNIYPPVYYDHIDYGRRRMDDMRRDGRVKGWVDYRGDYYRNRYRDDLYRYYDRYSRYHDNYRDRYRYWWKEGFYGGCYWDFHPYYDIHTYFYNPVVYWFYVSDYDDYYYRTWYGSSYDRYPELRTAFRHVGAFYPTEEFRDLNLGVSATSIETQVKYRRAMGVFGDQIEREVRRRGGYGLDDNSVVINHYQILPDVRGIVVEGFVIQGQAQFAFKALLDLVNPDSSRIFAVDADQDVYMDGLDELRDLNTQIEDWGGVAEGLDPDDY